MTNTILQATGALLITASAAFVHPGLSVFLAGVFLLVFGVARGLK